MMRTILPISLDGVKSLTSLLEELVSLNEEKRAEEELRKSLNPALPSHSVNALIKLLGDDSSTRQTVTVCSCSLPPSLLFKIILYLKKRIHFNCFWFGIRSDVNCSVHATNNTC